MTRILWLLGSLLLASGCATAPPPEPQAPIKQAQKTIEEDPSEPYHVAPPPAYGNKVVLAKEDCGPHPG